MTHSRYESLDFWRGVACLFVVVFHSTFYASAAAPVDRHDPGSWFIAAAERMWIGVPMFFVISGYCISATVDSARRRNLPIRSYFARRIRRIFPPYLICVALTIPFVQLLDMRFPGLFCDDVHGFLRPTSITPTEWLGNLTLTEEWRHHFIRTESGWLLGQAWTLSYEEQFYAVAGVLLWCCPRRFFTGAAVVSVLVLVSPVAPHGLFIDGYWLQFAAGILVYYVCVCARPQHRNWLLLPLAAGIAYAFSDIGELLQEKMQPRQHALASYGFALMLAWLRHWDLHIAATRFVQPLAWCGRRCYSLYLVHWPICKALSHGLWLMGLQSTTGTCLVTVPLCLAASVLAGHVFYQSVERRFVNLRASTDASAQLMPVPPERAAGVRAAA